ncbi:MAG: class I SAM-dependent methyltransferase [Thermoprotei archaeon]
MNEECHGLKDKWFMVESSLNAIPNIYDKTSRLMSLGTDAMYRKESLKNIIRPSTEIVLDAGSGTGLMTSALLEISTRLHDLIIEFDASRSMMKLSKMRFKRRPDIQFVIGVFEYLPFKDCSIDLAMCGFSLRDAINMKMAVKEVSRVLKNNGYFVILDMGKPSFPLLKIVFAIYWTIIPVLVVALIDVNYVKHYSKLLFTYLRYPTKDKMLHLLKQFFNNVNHYFKALGGVSIFILRKS